jgi:hypothetical protein
MHVISLSHLGGRKTNSKLSHGFRVVLQGILPSFQIEFRSLFSMSKASAESKSRSEGDGDGPQSTTSPSKRITRNVHNEALMSDRGINGKTTLY